jgi:hypothetical protein
MAESTFGAGSKDSGGTVKIKSLLLQQQTTIDLSQRAEMLKVEDFIILANEYETLTHPK